MTPRLGVECIDGIHQAENAGADQVIQFDAVGKPLPDAVTVVTHQGHVLFNQAISQVDVVGISFILIPHFLDFFVGCGLRCHPILRELTTVNDLLA